MPACSYYRSRGCKLRFFITDNTRTHTRSSPRLQGAQAQGGAPTCPCDMLGAMRYNIRRRFETRHTATTPPHWLRASKRHSGISICPPANAKRHTRTHTKNRPSTSHARIVRGAPGTRDTRRDKWGGDLGPRDLSHSNHAVQFDAPGRAPGHRPYSVSTVLTLPLSAVIFTWCTLSPASRHGSGVSAGSRGVGSAVARNTSATTPSQPAPALARHLDGKVPACVGKGKQRLKPAEVGIALLVGTHALVAASGSTIAYCKPGGGCPCEGSTKA